MAPREERFTQGEANEILRTAVRLSAAEKLNIGALVKAAEEIGISRADVERAEADFNRLRTEEGARKEFRRLQTNQFKIWILYGLLYTLVSSALGIGRSHFWSALPFFGGLVALGWAYAAYCLLFPGAPPYKKKFEDWRVQESGYLTPEDAHQVVEGVVVEAVENSLTRHNAELILALKVGYDDVRSKEVLDAFLAEHPEYARRLS